MVHWGLLPYGRIKLVLFDDAFNKFVWSFLKTYCDILLFDMSSSLHFLKGVRHYIWLSNQGESMVLFWPPATKEVPQIKKLKKWKTEEIL